MGSDLSNKRDAAGNYGKIFQAMIDEYSKCSVIWQQPTAPLVTDLDRDAPSDSYADVNADQTDDSYANTNEKQVDDGYSADSNTNEKQVRLILLQMKSRWKTPIQRLELISVQKRMRDLLIQLQA